MERVFQDGGVQMVFGAMSWLQMGQQVLWPGAFRKQIHGASVGSGMALNRNQLLILSIFPLPRTSVTRS